MIEVMTKLTPAKFVTWMQGFLDAHHDETRGYFLSSNDVVKLRERLDSVDLTETPAVVNNVTHNHHEKSAGPEYDFNSATDAVLSRDEAKRKFTDALHAMMRPKERPDCVELSKALEKLGTPYFMAPDSPIASPIGAMQLARGLGMLAPEMRDDEAKLFVTIVRKFIAHVEKQMARGPLIDRLTPIATSHINRLVKANTRPQLLALPVIQRAFIIQWLFALEYEAYSPAAMVVACSTEGVKRDDEHVILTLLQFIFDESVGTFDVVGVTRDVYCVIDGKVSKAPALTTRDIATILQVDPTDALAPDALYTGKKTEDEDSAKQDIKVEAEETALALGQDILIETRRAPADYGPGLRRAYYLVDGIRGQLFSEVAVPAIEPPCKACRTPLGEHAKDCGNSPSYNARYGGAGLSVPRHLEADDADDSF
jgi:hypothetical protein